MSNTCSLNAQPLPEVLAFKLTKWDNRQNDPTTFQQLSCASVHKLGNFVAGEKVGHFVVMGQFVALKMPVKQCFLREHQWDILSPGRKWGILSLGQFVAWEKVGQFVVGTKCLLTSNHQDSHNVINIIIMLELVSVSVFVLVRPCLLLFLINCQQEHMCLRQLCSALRTLNSSDISQKVTD